MCVLETLHTGGMPHTTNKKPLDLNVDDRKQNSFHATSELSSAHIIQSILNEFLLNEGKKEKQMNLSRLWVVTC